MDNPPVELAALIARAWLDEEFKELVENDPAAAFSQFGLSYDPSEPITVPPRPEGLDMSHLNETEPQPSSIDCTSSLRVYKDKVLILSHDGRKQEFFKKTSQDTLSEILLKQDEPMPKS